MNNFLSYELMDIQKFGSIEKATEEGYFWLWNDGKIARAFNYGTGNIKDFMEFVKNNKSNGFIVVDLNTGKVYNTSRKIDIEKVKQSFDSWNIDKFGIPTTRR